MSKRTNGEVINDVIEKLKSLHSIQLFSGVNGELYISLDEDGKKRTLSLASTQWQAWLVRFLKANDLQVPPGIRDEITVYLSASAESESKKNVCVRIARTEKSVQIDLNDDSFNVVRITGSKGGFELKQPNGVYLIRPKKQLSLPIPESIERSEFIEMFKRLIPNVTYGHWLLVLAFVLKSLNRDRGSYVILIIGGPQGSGKTILSRRIKMLVDPADPPFFSPPKNADDIIIAARNSFLLVYENMSGISHEMADVFCRLATGGGISKRKHYTDHEEVFYKLHRPVIINGIDEPSNRPDFVDRCVTIELNPIIDSDRIAETELDKEFVANLPRLLGGLYELLADCLKILPTISEKNLPRMTDYALMGIAAEKALKLPPGYFLKAYGDNRSEQIESNFWNDDLCGAIYTALVALSKIDVAALEGTAQELIPKIFEKRWGSGVSIQAPKSARGFSGWLKRVEPVLSTRGIIVERLPRSADKRIIRIRFKDKKSKGGDM